MQNVSIFKKNSKIFQLFSSFELFWNLNLNWNWNGLVWIGTWIGTE